ncbi:hypothetical protein AJ80_09076 [Polytolypa hystricis UAMH7299]|uniref:PH domain-containing protein n=1 Tax=Polytolypa hystricis (strain UAMH7299) TaxID=1447883 RepID=A0A2B7WWP1_POLH7|nr:hypothetical protein AJ80_09076 [Polytolypa hystricis UAMH7299]
MEKVTLPQRSSTMRTTATAKTTATTGSLSDDEAIPDSDLSGTTALLFERLQAWKHMCAYLENYVTATQKVQKTQSKEFEKILKTVSEPLKEAHHFDLGKGGVAGLFDNLRENTQGIANLHLETERNLKARVLPILEGIHVEIKKKGKELKSGATKGTKQVEKARTLTQKHIELLGQYAATFDSSSLAKLDASHDPYVLNRGVYHRLNKQITEENNNFSEMLVVQNSFHAFEAHILETVQNALNQFFQCMGAQTDRQRAMYADMVGHAQQIPADFEWANFFERNDAALINPNTPLRTMSSITFPNQEHRATKPVMEGTLERKSRAIVKGYSAAYYAVSPSGYLHGFKDNDDIRTEPEPEISLHLPDCTVGKVEGLKFDVKGKDVSGAKVGHAFALSTEWHFKARSKTDAEQWLAAITTAVNRSAANSVPTSPSVMSRVASGTIAPEPVQPLASPTTTTPPAVAPIATEEPPQEDGVVATAAAPAGETRS